MSGGLRKRRNGFFVQVPRETVRDKRLSFRARGVLVFILDQPDGWDVNSEWIAKQGKEGRDAVRTALQELRDRGYYRLERQRLRNGRVVMGTAVSETSVPEWIEQSAEAGGDAVIVIEQPDESFLVQRADGTTEADGFDHGADGEALTSRDGDQLTVSTATTDGDRADASTGAGFSGPGTGDGFSGSGKPGSGNPVAGKSGALRETEKGEATRTPLPSPQQPAAGSVTADAATDGALALDLSHGDNATAPASLSIVADPDLFEEFWTAYPASRKVAKAEARKAFTRAVRDTDPHVVIAAATALAADPNLPGGPNDPRGPGGVQFVPHPTTWLNQRRWEDTAPLPPLGGGQPTTAFTNAALGWDTTPSAAATSPMSDADLAVRFGAADPGARDDARDPHDPKHRKWDELFAADVVECSAQTADGHDLATFEDQEAAQIVQRFIRGAAAKQSPVNMIVQGPTRIGKTSAAVAAGHQARAAGLSVRMVKHLDYLRATRPDATVPNGITLREYEKRYREVDLLIVDDLGVADGTGERPASRHATEQTMKLIGDRATAGKHTIVTTNLRHQFVVRLYGQQLADRMATDVVVARMQGGPRGGVNTEW